MRASSSLSLCRVVGLAGTVLLPGPIDRVLRPGPVEIETVTFPWIPFFQKGQTMYTPHSTLRCTIPETGFLRQTQILRLVPVSRSTLWRYVRNGFFPRPLKLSTGVTVWRAEEVRRWISDYQNEC